MTQIRKIVFANDEIYHILNRSVGKIEILLGSRELKRAIELIDYYRFPHKLRYSKYKALNSEDKQNYINSIKKQKPLVEIYSFSLMPDHYHIIAKQIKENGIKNFISNFQNAFAKYFNRKNNRDGSLFKSPFSSKWIGDEETFIHLSRYIHLNPVTSYIIQINELPSYQWTSFPYYVGNKKGDLVNTEFILKIVGSASIYKKFVFNRADYQRKLNIIKKIILE